MNNVPGKPTHPENLMTVLYLDGRLWKIIVNQILKSLTLTHFQIPEFLNSGGDDLCIFVFAELLLHAVWLIMWLNVQLIMQSIISLPLNNKVT